MSAASRVPLLPKGKSRKPTRLTIAPRAKPSNGDRSKRVASPSEAGTPSEGASASPEKAGNSVEKQAATSAPKVNGAPPPVIPIAVTAKSPMAPPAAPASVASVPVAKRIGGISVGSSFGSSAPVRKPVVAPVTRSPVILPVQRHTDKGVSIARVERLAKISGVGPVYRTQVSPVLGPRATLSPGLLPQSAKDGGNPLVKRLVRKLDIKPHQSPRRAVQMIRHPRTESMSSLTNSPLILAGRAPPSMDKDDEDVDILGEGAVGKKAGPRPRDAIGKKRPAKRRKGESESSKASKETAIQSAQSRRQSLKRQAKKSPRYRAEEDSQDEPDDDRDEDVDPEELEEQPRSVYVPARERATMWAKSLIDGDENNDSNAPADDSRALVSVRKPSPSNRRKRSSSNASSIASLASLTHNLTTRKKSELMKKEPSQMTMGELALTIPKGRRMKRHEREEAADGAPASSEGRRSSLLNMGAFKRIRSLSVSSESAALGGSLVTPRVQIIDGKMVVMESTVKLDEQASNLDDEDDFDVEENGLPPRRSGILLNASHPNGPGRRWSKDETKQFFYCLSQVGPNFSMMATLFPKRKRKELKSKFKYEEKNHPRLIEIALRASAAPLDSEMVDAIAKMVDREEQEKMEKQKKRRRRSSSIMTDGNEDDAPVSPMSAPEPTYPLAEEDAEEEELEEIVEETDEYMHERRGSFDFAG